MPAKLLPKEQVPTLVQERIRVWGMCVKTQRVAQRMKAAELCARIGISEATLRRVERGDPAVGVGLFLSALLVLGILDEVAAMPGNPLWTPGPRVRVKTSPKDDDDDF